MISQSASPGEGSQASAIRGALAAFQGGRLEEAESQLQALLSETPSEPHALHLLGVIFHQRGMLPEAIAVLERAVMADGRRAALHGELGNAYWSAGRIAEAAAAFRRALQLEPRLGAARFALGSVLLQQGANQDAVRELARAVAEAPDHARGHLNLGVGLCRLGRRKEGLGHLRRAVELGSDDPMPFVALGFALREDGDRWGALRYISRAVELGPNVADAHLELGRTFAALYRLDEAVAAFRRALALQPESVEILRVLGDTLLNLQQLEEAAHCFEKASTLAPQASEPLVGLGHVYLTRGEFDRAEECFTSLREIAPNLPVGSYGMALCAQHRGRLDEAAEWHERVLAVSPDHCEAHHQLAIIRRHRPGDQTRSTVATLRQLLASSELPVRGRATLEIALGKIHNDVGDYEAAFRHYRSGNDLRKREYPTPYDPRSFTVEIDKMISVFTEEFFQEKGRIGSNSALPVFIVGVTRSGTTLVEQIIASHSQVRGRGELDYMRQIARAVPVRLETAEPYPQCLAALTRPLATALADEYLARLGETPEGIARSVDKRPGNFVRLGLIALLFPRARIIHCVRDPIDTCLSSYFLGNRFAPFANDLAWMGKYYRDYQRAMTHYRAVLPNPILDVPYEALTEDQEGWTRRLVNFLDLPWDERCLAFEKTERPVSTPSFWQVRQPIYRSSIGRWRPYRKHLGPLFEALGIAPPDEAT